MSSQKLVLAATGAVESKRVSEDFCWNPEFLCWRPNPSIVWDSNRSARPEAMREDFMSKADTVQLSNPKNKQILKSDGLYGL